MRNQRQNEGYGFGPSVRKPSTKKKPRSRLFLRSLKEWKKTQECYRLPAQNRNNNANKRGNDYGAKIAGLHNSRTYDSSKMVNVNDHHDKVVAQKMRQIPSEEPSNARAAPQPNDLKRLSSLMRNNGSSRPNNGVVSPQKNNKKSRPSSRLKSGVVSPQKNIEKSRPNCMVSTRRNVETSRPSSSRLSNDMVSPEKNIKKSSPSSLRPSNGIVSLQKTIKKSRPSRFRDGSSSGKLEKIDFVGSKDDSNLTLGILKKYHPSPTVHKSSNTEQIVSGEVHKQDLGMAEEASNSILDLKGNQIIQDLRCNLRNNSSPKFGKNLRASCMGNNVEWSGESRDGCVQLDSRNQNTSLVEDGRTDDDKLKSKRKEPLPEEKSETHEDNDSEEAENCRPTKRRRYIANEDEDDQDLAGVEGGTAGLTTRTALVKDQNTSLVEDGRTNDDKFKSKRKEPLPEEKSETHDDNDSEEAENCRPTKRRRYMANEDEGNDDGDQDPAGVEGGTAGVTTRTALVKDRRTEVSMPFVSDSVKLQHYGSIPIDEPIWSGTLKIGSKEYASLAAHLSTKSCENVWKSSRSLRPVLEVTKLPRLEAWPKRFEEASRPNDEDIALYFLPHEMRPDEDLDQLVKDVMENDLVLRAVIGEAEMLIFASILLPEQHQAFQSKPYLWGVFKRRENVAIVEEQQHGIGRCAQEEEKGKQHASHCGVRKDGYRVAGLNMDVGLGAPKEAERQGMEQELTPLLARPNALHLAEGAARPTSAPKAAAMPANHGQIHSSLGVPSGAMFIFVDRQTPRLEKLMQEMVHEGAVVVAIRGEMTASGLGQPMATG